MFCVKSFAIFSAVLAIVGCQTSGENWSAPTERELTVANFVPMPAASAAVADKVPRLSTRPSDFYAISSNPNDTKYYLYDPKKKIVWVGSVRDYQRWKEMRVQSWRSHDIRSEQSRMRAAQVGQLVAQGMAQFGQNMQQQAAIQQQNAYQQQLVLLQAMQRPSFSRNQPTTFRPDGFGGYRGSDGSTLRPDGFGGFRATEGY